MAKFREQYEILIRWLAHRVRNICSRSGRMASLYYFVFSRKFDREHLSVLQGKQRYAHFFGFWGESSPRLRRNIHRLEKGLIMRPRRNVFAESFIAETVDLFRLASDSSVFDEGELKWACDVLREYFCAVEPTPVVKAASTHFHSIIASVRSQGKTISYSPYPHRCLPDIDLAIDELERLCTRRRSVRWYQDLAVTRESIENAVRIAALAPSACNRQSFRFLVTTDKAEASKVAECVGGTQGFSDNIPAMVVVVGDLSSYPHERDRHLIYIDASMAVMQLMLALEVQGLSTCPINWPDLQLPEDNIRKIVDLPQHERVIMLVAVGHADPDGGIPYSQKKVGHSIMEVLG